MYYLLLPFTWLLTLLYNLVGDYGTALIIFAAVIKLILFPLSIKGKRGMIQMNMLQGKMSAIQRKYPNNRAKQNEEIQALYTKEKVNPMSGCIWSFLPLLILLPLYAIIREPFANIMALTAEEITTLLSVLQPLGEIPPTTDYYYQLTAANVLSVNFEAVMANPQVAEFSSKLVDLNFQFLGVNLAEIPNPMFWTDGLAWSSFGLFLIPLVSAASGFLMTRISMRTNAMNNPNSAQAGNQMKMMMWMSPIMSLWIGFVMPACLGIYWVANNLFAMVQELVAAKILKKDYEAAAKAREDAERLEKEEEKERRRLSAERKAQALEERKSGKKKTQSQPTEKKKTDGSVISVSGVGVRAYARGRAYDPNRFSEDGPTPYRDPGAPVDEDAVEAALTQKELAADGLSAEDLNELDSLPEAQLDDVTPEAPDADSESADEKKDWKDRDPWE